MVESETPVLGIVRTLNWRLWKLAFCCYAFAWGSHTGSPALPSFFRVYCSLSSPCYSHIPPNHQQLSLEACLILWLWPCIDIADLISKPVGRVAQVLSASACSEGAATEAPQPGQYCHVTECVHCVCACVGGRGALYLRSHAIHLALFCLFGKQICSLLSCRINSPKPPYLFLSPESTRRFSASFLLITVFCFLVPFQGESESSPCFWK